jgi:hypothetical protein
MIVWRYEHFVVSSNVCASIMLYVGLLSNAPTMTLGQQAGNLDDLMHPLLLLIINNTLLSSRML